MRPAKNLIRILAVLALAAAPRVGHAQSVLPTLPLPDCVANGLSPGQSVDCEGMILSGIFYGSPPETSRPTPGSIGVLRNPGTIDFRNDADRGGPQPVIITLQLPNLPDVTLPNGNTVRSAIHIEWPAGFGPGNGFLNCKHTGPGPADQWRVDGCDFFSPGPGQGSALFWREGPNCATTETSCTYRVRWSAYQTRVRHPMILRAYLRWYLVHTQQKPNGEYPTGCSSLGPQGCLAGGGQSWFTFAVSGPPPPLVIDARARRLGAATFEFDGTGSGPDVRTWQWVKPGSQEVYATTPTFTRGFTYDDLPFGVGQVVLNIVDRWERAALMVVNVSLLAPAGVEGPLELRSFEALGIDDTGLVTMRAVVRNVSQGEIANVFTLGSEFLGLVSVQATPDSATIAAGAEAEFIVTARFDDRDSMRITAQAFGTSASGSVKSAEKRITVRKGSIGPPPSSTTTTTSIPGGSTTTTTLPPGGSGSTTTSSASAPGDTTIEVASNDGFAPGGYATVNPGGATAETRQIAALGSLVFRAPLAFGHAAGEPVIAVEAPGGDTEGPRIAVTVPAGETVVCQDAPLLAAFTCDDAGVGVAECGGGVAVGQPLATTTAGPQQRAIRAWDHNGNLTEGVLRWTVRGPEGFEGLACVLDAVDAALASAVPPDLDAKWKGRLQKATRGVRAKVAAAQAASTTKKRAKQLKTAGALVKRLQAQVAKGVKTKKISSSLGATLRARLDGGQAALAGLRAAP